jgi:hypothetical protein
VTVLFGGISGGRLWDAVDARDEVFGLSIKTFRPMQVPWPVSREEDCPGHVASEYDRMICGRCGVHINDLLPTGDDLC